MDNKFILNTERLLLDHIITTDDGVIVHEQAIEIKDYDEALGTVIIDGITYEVLFMADELIELAGISMDGWDFQEDTWDYTTEIRYITFHAKALLPHIKDTTLEAAIKELWEVIK